MNNELLKKVRFFKRFVTTSVFFTMTVVQQLHSNKQTNKLYCVFIICSDKRSMRFASKPTVIPLINFRKLIVIKIKCGVWINSKPFLVPPKVLHKLYYFPTHRSEITFTKSVRPKSHTSELACVCGFPWRVLGRGAPLTPADYFTFQGNAITAEWVQTFSFFSKCRMTSYIESALIALTHVIVIVNLNTWKVVCTIKPV